MTTKDVKRKLTAILSADVQGYSRLMGDDEGATVQTITAYRKVMTDFIQEHHGRVVDAKGDNVLAEFPSVVDAIQCAVEIQKELKVKNADLPEHRRMEFRIGINLGDVIEEEETIYGDGVNIAARLESLAEGGGICISGTAFDQIGKKVPLGYKYLGEQTVKNIDKPIRVYKALVEPEAIGKVIGEKRRLRKWHWAAFVGLAVLIVAGALATWNFYLRPDVEPASVEKMAFPLPDKPSIAVLPFDNMSEDPKQEYFSDGITENIITGLSKVGDLFVISRNSSFTYKGKPVKVQKVSEDLGVRYVLEGSVMKSGDRVRITAQLIDAIKGHHIWAERYDRHLNDIFAVQDEITKKILQALRVTLTKKGHMITRDTDNLDAYLKYLEGLTYLYRATKKDNLKAKQLCEEAIALDPNYVKPQIVLGWAHFFDARFGWVDSRGDSIKKGFVLAKKAVDLNDEDALAHSLLGALYMKIKDFDKAIEECERGVALNPNGSDIMMTLGAILSVSGRWEEGARWLEKSIRHERFPSMHYFYWLGRAYVMLGRYDAAVTQFEKAHQTSPESPLPFIGLAIAYSLSGRQQESKKAAEEVMKINPRFSIAAYAKTLPYKNQSDKDTWIEGLRKAGLPETPPLSLPDKPSIAVLPFVNMSGDQEQEYFSDGLTEDIITALSKTSKLFVIARNSTFTYKGKPVKVQQVGRELGVKYVLEGSVRKSGDKVRITAQLVDAQTGHHLWAERYDRELKDIFAIQDEITKKIITSVHVKLTEGEQGRLYAKGTANLDAYLKASEASWYSRQGTREGLLKAKKLAEEAIDLDPKYPAAYSTLGMFYGVSIWYGMSESPTESLKRAIELSQKAIALDESFAPAHVGLGYWLTMARQYDKAITEGKRAMALEPGSADVLQNYAMILTYAGRFEEAIPLFREAFRLNPMPPNNYYRHFGFILREAGHYDEAIAIFKKAIDRGPDDQLAHIGMAVTLTYAGRMDEARAAAKECLRINPKFSAEKFGKVIPMKDPAVTTRIVEALKKAGLK